MTQPENKRLLTEAKANATYGRLSTLPVNVADFGLVSDGNLDTRAGTDNLAAFNAAIAAASVIPASKRAVYVPPGTYSVSDTIIIPSGLRFYGDDPSACRIVCPKPGVPVVASKSWADTSAPGGRTVIEGILVRAEANDPNSHGIILRDFHSAIRRCVAQQCGGDGFRASAANKAGTLIGNTLVENYYQSLFADQNKGWGFNQAATNGTQLTDAHMNDIVARGVAQAGNAEAAEAQGGISIPFAAGWQVSKIHTYGRFRTDGVVFGNLWGGSILDGAHIEQGYENVGLRMPNFQRGGIVDNIIIAMSEYGTRTMLQATKHATLYPGEGLQIGTLTLVSNFADIVGTGVTWNSATAPLRISNFSLAGERVANITPFGGVTSSIKVGADLPNYLELGNLEALIQQKIDEALANGGGGTPQEPTPETIVFADDFNRANGAAGNTAVGNKPWLYHDTAPGGMAIDTNRMKLTTASSVVSMVVDAGTANGILEGTLAVTDVGNTGIVFRSTSAGDQFRLSRTGSADKRYQLTRRVGGASTTLAQLTKQIADGDRIKVVLDGPSITLFINDVQEWQGSDSTHLGATKHGFYNGANNLLMYDDIKFTIPASG